MLARTLNVTRLLQSAIATRARQGHPLGCSKSSFNWARRFLNNAESFFLQDLDMIKN